MAIIAVAGVALAALPTALKWLLLGWLVIWALWMGQRTVLGCGGVTRLTYRYGWWLEAGECERRAELLDARLWSWLVVLRFKLPGRRRPWVVTLLNDSADPDALRQLRVLLRHFPVYQKGEKPLGE